MNSRVNFEELAASGTTHQQALELFDSLGPITVEEMLGKWKGSGFATHHPMDGLLENFNWWGKEFVSAEDVHPLVFDGKSRHYVLDPRWMPLKYARNTVLSVNPVARWVFRTLLPVLQTSQSRARLRMLEHRGVVSATMVYDEKPINDVFRKIDDDTLLGLMDLKRSAKPFFFILKRVR